MAMQSEELECAVKAAMAELEADDKVPYATRVWGVIGDSSLDFKDIRTVMKRLKNPDTVVEEKRDGNCAPTRASGFREMPAARQGVVLQSPEGKEEAVKSSSSPAESILALL